MESMDWWFTKLTVPELLEMCFGIMEKLAKIHLNLGKAMKSSRILRAGRGKNFCRVPSGGEFWYYSKLSEKSN